LPRGMQATRGRKRLTTSENEPYLRLTGKDSVVDSRMRALRPKFE
jgi:hypothetical protein